jgi:hypothetical protein
MGYRAKRRGDRLELIVTQAFFLFDCELKLIIVGRKLRMTEGDCSN